MKQRRKLPGILIYLLILFFSIVSFVYALHESVISGYNQVTSEGGTTTSDDGVVISKTIKETDTENFFDITLTVKTEKNVVEITEDPDIAVVVVMDISDSMLNYTLDDGSDRFTAAQEAAKTLIKEYTDYSVDVNAVRKFGFVAFNTNAHEIISLQDIGTETQSLATTKATTLSNEVVKDTNTIVTSLDKYNTPYRNESHTRYTNIEAGLKRGKDMLSDSSLEGIENKYLILLSDGLPTTYINPKTTYEGHNPFMLYDRRYNRDFDSSKTYTASDEGIFYNELKGSGGLNEFGPNYSNTGAIRARDEATRVKNKGIKVYSVGVGFGEDDDIRQSNMKESIFVDVKKSDYEANGNQFEAGITYGDFKNWLETKIGSKDRDPSGTYYYDTNDTEALKNAYKSIFSEITKQSEESISATWVAKDPMGVNNDVENIEFIGFFDKNGDLQSELSIDNSTQNNTASFSDNTISWDLKKSNFTETQNGDTTIYYYEIKYRVRLSNELTGFTETNTYDTNGTTKLRYVVRNAYGVLSEDRYLEFPKPAVAGYLGELTFTKKSAKFNNIASTTLEGVVFHLTHSSDCSCKKGYKNLSNEIVDIDTMKATSDKDGTVTFTNIPSGHQYVLSEYSTLDDYNKLSTTYTVNVDYDKTETNIKKDSNDKYYINNELKKGNLKISKIVEGNKNYKGNFEFKLKVKYLTTTLIGEYLYTKTDADGNKTTGTIDLKEDTIYLKDGESIEIKNLPIGAKYEIEELNTNGYTVKHTITGVNDGKRIISPTAVCNNNSCSIDSEKAQEVVFYNIAGYILPATGSSGMLILVIIASLLLIVPIINIGYMFYKNRKEGKLTS